MSATIPEKRYFKIGEVAKIVDVPPHVLRYWETEFKEIKPCRAGSKHRLYSRQDVKTILKIRILLKEQGLTIAGAKKIFQGELGNPKTMLQQLSSKVEQTIAKNERAWQPFLPMMEKVLISSQHGNTQGTLSTRQRLTLLKQSLIELQKISR